MSSIVDILSILWLLVIVAAPSCATEYRITKPGCNETCEKSDVMIPYPFGIGRNCYDNSSEHYEIICKPPDNSSSSTGAFKTILRKLNIEVLRIGFAFDEFNNFGSNELEVASETHNICKSAKRKSNSSNRNISSSVQYSRDLQGTPFLYKEENQFVVQGCTGHVNLRNPSGDVIGGCSSFCKEDANIESSVCNGLGCCLITLPNNQGHYVYDYFEIELSDMVYAFPALNTTSNNHTCMNVTLSMDPSTISLSPIRARWRWSGPPCLGANYNCHGLGSVDCGCELGYRGNPYLPYGCQATRTKVETKRKAMITGLGISLGSITFLVIGYGSFHLIRRWIRIKRKAKFFKRNGGLLLQQQVTSSDNKVDNTKVFSVDELDKATDGFNANRVLGRGGQGTVYKGMLLDGRVVAIKKSLKVDDSQIGQFINEVVILSQINHRNVVKLLGCCLETEVPLLVYEYIQNGTLSHHIQDSNEDFHITWKMRLQIAAESAGALTYLHSASGTPIYHRDIKSSNILLDEKYRAKVADFGTSRTVMIDQTHLTTLVQGTLGYLDPEYFQTNQFTEKSDVYSFGVVLIELLTSKKPLSSVPSGGWRSLAMDFLLHMQSSRVFDIIDPQITEEAKEEELLALAKVAKGCLNLNGKKRPTMREVANVLEGIRSSTLPSTIYHTDSDENDEILEVGQMHEAPVATRTFQSENIIGASSSVEVKPLMHYQSL